jgi:hypothetical protein
VLMPLKNAWKVASEMLLTMSLELVFERVCVVWSWFVYTRASKLREGDNDDILYPVAGILMNRRSTQLFAWSYSNGFIEFTICFSLQIGQLSYCVVYKLIENNLKLNVPSTFSIKSNNQSIIPRMGRKSRGRHPDIQTSCCLAVLVPSASHCLVEPVLSVQLAPLQQSGGFCSVCSAVRSTQYHLCYLNTRPSPNHQGPTLQPRDQQSTRCYRVWDNQVVLGCIRTPAHLRNFQSG